jgi:hypothetical protein
MRDEEPPEKNKPAGPSKNEVPAKNQPPRR